LCFSPLLQGVALALALGASKQPPPNHIAANYAFNDT
jgi:hypothetical protein